MSEPADDLYRNEAYKFGSKAKELEEFQEHVARVLAAQQRLAGKHFSGQPHRVFHTKSHGCLTGKLNLLEDRPEHTRHGIFASNGKTSYDVLVRFSNGVGSNQHDLIPDVRGIGLKIFGVTDPATDPDGQRPRTIDFLMTNSTNAFGSDQQEFVEFMEANVDPGPLKLKLLFYLLKHPAVARLLIKASFRIVSSLTTERYWSGHAYLLGPDQAMKFNVRPGEQPVIKERTKLNRNYLSIDLLNRARGGPIKFIFCVQLEKNKTSTPIENGLVEWEESDSPSIDVAHLVLDQQDNSYDCENLSFTPGHYIPAHRPLGNIGRGRIFTYEASQKGRGAGLSGPDLATIKQISDSLPLNDATPEEIIQRRLESVAIETRRPARPNDAKPNGVNPPIVPSAPEHSAYPPVYDKSAGGSTDDVTVAAQEMALRQIENDFQDKRERMHSKLAKIQHQDTVIFWTLLISAIIAVALILWGAYSFFRSGVNVIAVLSEMVGLLGGAGTAILKRLQKELREKLAHLEQQEDNQTEYLQLIQTTLALTGPERDKQLVETLKWLREVRRSSPQMPAHKRAQTGAPAP